MDLVRSRLVARLAATTVLAIGVALHAQNPRDQHSPGPEAFSSRVLASDLENPWTVLWGPDGYLWVTERTAFRVKRLNPADGSARVALALTDGYQSVVQDGLMGMALHPDLLQGRGRDYVFVAYTYDADPGPGLTRRLRVRRYTYDRSSATLSAPTDVLSNLPAHNDHGGGALVIGPDNTLFLSRGDLGANFLANYCMPLGAQDLPSARDVESKDWTSYQGKVLRMNLDGSIPSDNPVIGGVRSHIYTYGHRNIQGLVFGNGGRLYASEHGPSSDDEINLLAPGKNYGWPHVAGFNDDRGYVYANWSASAPEPCRSLTFNNLNPPPSVPQAKESAWSHRDFVPPLLTLFTVPADQDLRVIGNVTIGPGGIDLYSATAIPDWSQSLLVTGMRTGIVYRLKLNADGTGIAGTPVEYFRSADRYRDLAISPDGRHIFVATDNFGTTSDASGKRTESLANPGALVEFTYAPDRGNAR